MKRIYFDHNATTPIAPEVLAAMLPYLTEEYGNASSIHAFGQNARGSGGAGSLVRGGSRRRARRGYHVHQRRHGVE